MSPLSRTVTKIKDALVFLSHKAEDDGLENQSSVKNSESLSGLSAEETFVNVSSAAELLLHLEFAASALKKSAPRPRQRGETKIAFDYRCY
jgi:hypothetical protein